MLASPPPSADETRDNACFDALLWALSRPGLPRTLPEPGERSIIAALLDRECRAYAADPLLVSEIMRTGAEIAELGAADHVFLGALGSNAALGDIAIGSDLYPDDGASVIIRAKLGEGAHLRLTGPGINEQVSVQISGLPEGFWDARAARIRYPVGFDLFLLDGAQVLGIPRSTKVETL
jgi:alpha-D-ribose 1-methylphosphonate 5-triphosphate synthase subunit PhnH